MNKTLLIFCSFCLSAMLASAATMPLNIVDEYTAVNAAMAHDAAMDELFNEDFGMLSEYNPPSSSGSRGRRSTSEASRRSQSRRHTGSPNRSYSPPESSSVQAGSLGSDRPRPTSSNVGQTRGQNRQPLMMSKRDRYFGVGSRELGFNFGTAHSFTDLQASKGLGFGESVSFQISNPGVAAGIYSRFRMVDWFGLSLGFDYARLTGTDGGTTVDFEGFSFENNILEFNARIAFYAPLATKNEFDIYAFAGLALFNNNLKLRNADGIEVAPAADYATVQPAIPFGVGFSWVAGYRLVVGYELGYRYTSFNLLDGVDLPNTRYDSYMFNTLRIGFILKPRRR